MKYNSHPFSPIRTVFLTNSHGFQFPELRKTITIGQAQVGSEKRYLGTTTLTSLGHDSGSCAAASAGSGLAGCNASSTPRLLFFIRVAVQREAFTQSPKLAKLAKLSASHKRLALIAINTEK